MTADCRGKTVPTLAVSSRWRETRQRLSNWSLGEKHVGLTHFSRAAMDFYAT